MLSAKSPWRASFDLCYGSFFLFKHCLQLPLPLSTFLLNYTIPAASAIFLQLLPSPLLTFSSKCTSTPLPLNHIFWKLNICYYTWLFLQEFWITHVARTEQDGFLPKYSSPFYLHRTQSQLRIFRITFMQSFMVISTQTRVLKLPLTRTGEGLQKGKHDTTYYRISCEIILPYTDFIIS